MLTEAGAAVVEEMERIYRRVAASSIAASKAICAARVASAMSPHATPELLCAVRALVDRFAEGFDLRRLVELTLAQTGHEADADTACLMLSAASRAAIFEGCMDYVSSTLPQALIAGLDERKGA